MGWLIFWLFALLAGLAMFMAELLGPSEPPTVRVLPPPAPRPQKEDEPRPARQPPEDAPPPVPAAPPAAEGGWLETQLALITAWSERMQQQIASSQADPDRCTAITTKEYEPRPARQPPEDAPPPARAAPPAAEGGWLETQLALITAWSERMQQQIASSQADSDPWRCIAITTKGSQCKLLAEPGDTKCAIHGGHPDRLPVSQCAGHGRDASHSHQPGGLISRAMSWPNDESWRAGR